MKITKVFEFDASHRLVDVELSKTDNERVFGKCFRPHGHRYKLEVTVEGTELHSGMLVNFTYLKAWVNNNIIDDCDHNDLNEVEWLKGTITTCEAMIKVFWDRLIDCSLSGSVKLAKLRLYETPNCYAEYSGEVHISEDNYIPALMNKEVHISEDNYIPAQIPCHE